MPHGKAIAPQSIKAISPTPSQTKVRSDVHFQEHVTGRAHGFIPVCMVELRLVEVVKLRFAVLLGKVMRPGFGSIRVLAVESRETQRMHTCSLRWWFG